ncbi:MAG: enoyl-CoA hydratase-related protein [Desulfarculaceae bacterium]|jgi:enoyl-CoA hydratase/carnithine racemase
MDGGVLGMNMEGPIAHIQIQGPWDDPARVEVFSGELEDCCQQASAEPEVALVVITGEGREAFAFKNQALFPRIEGLLSSPAGIISGLDLPVIGACAGEVSGLGLEMLMACDVRICTAETTFSLPQIKEGLMPADGGTQLLPRLVGKTLAMEMVLTGEPIAAALAQERGLVNRVAPAVELLTTALGMAKEMAEKAPIAMRYVKEAVNHGLDMRLEQGLRLEADLYLHLHTTQDRREGITAFQRKKKPSFTGQ